MRAAHLSLFVLAMVSLLSSAVAQSPAETSKTTVVRKTVAMRHVGARTQPVVKATKKVTRRAAARRAAKIHRFRHR